MREQKEQKPTEGLRAILSLRKIIKGTHVSRFVFELREEAKAQPIWLMIEHRSMN